MNKSGPEQPDERLSEELVAYLDGELSVSESEAIEARIGRDDYARTELQKFDRVWNALDQLPKSTVDDSFTRTTIEMATVEAKKELAQETAMLPIRRRSRWLKVAALATTAALVGFVALAGLLPNPNQQLYANLPVIMELDAYSEARDIDFLRLLKAEDGEWMLSEFGCEVNKRAQELASVNKADYRGRRQYVERLATDDRTDLASKHRRYQNLTPELRDELTSWHDELASADDSLDLQKMMLAYHSWVSRESELDQAQLRMLAPAERVERVEAMQRRHDSHLTPANELALRESFEAMVGDPEIIQLHRRFIDSLPNPKSLGEPQRPEDRFRRRFVDMFAKSNPRQAVPMVEFLSGFASSDASEMLAGLAKSDAPVAMFREYRDAIEHRLIEAMDRQTRSRLEGMAQHDRSRQLAQWLFIAKRPKKPDVATLEEFFENGNLSPDVKQRLLAMPKEEMLRELEGRYVDQFLGDEGNDDWQNLWPVGRGRRWGDRADWNNRDGREPPGDRPPPNERGPRGPRAFDPLDGPPPGAGPPPGEGPLPPPRRDAGAPAPI